MVVPHPLTYPALLLLLHLVFDSYGSARTLRGEEALYVRVHCSVLDIGMYSPIHCAEWYLTYCNCYELVLAWFSATSHWLLVCCLAACSSASVAAVLLVLSVFMKFVAALDFAEKLL